MPIDLETGIRICKGHNLSEKGGEIITAFFNEKENIFFKDLEELDSYSLFMSDFLTLASDYNKNQNGVNIHPIINRFNKINRSRGNDELEKLRNRYNERLLNLRNSYIDSKIPQEVLKVTEHIKKVYDHASTVPEDFGMKAPFSLKLKRNKNKIILTSGILALSAIGYFSTNQSEVELNQEPIIQVDKIEINNTVAQKVEENVEKLEVLEEPELVEEKVPAVTSQQESSEKLQTIAKNEVVKSKLDEQVIREGNYHYQAGRKPEDVYHFNKDGYPIIPALNNFNGYRLTCFDGEIGCINYQTGSIISDKKGIPQKVFGGNLINRIQEGQEFTLFSQEGLCELFNSFHEMDRVDSVEYYNEEFNKSESIEILKTICSGVN